MDSTVSAELFTPPLISRSQFDTLFSDIKPLTSEATRIETFSALVESFYTKPRLTKSDLDLAFATATGWTCTCQRQFGLAASSRLLAHRG